MSKASHESTTQSHARSNRRPFWDIDKLSRYLGVGQTWIYNRTRVNGPELIPHIKVGKYLRFEPDSESFHEWLEDHRVEKFVG